ncbi:unnamed protein product [Chilo suppressalis]|uniref:Sphingomyelin phosphodiesterase n=1 Tax=Chilo suppressalis TaxID=168631 RepID=A0ABN8BHK0_CHISP|nr:unnamed protein product [Chilo suppressalis]
MKVLVLFCMLLSSSVASHLITFNDAETLLTKFALGELSEKDKTILTNVLEILYRPEPVTEKWIENTSEIRLALDCLVCRSAFRTLFTGVLNGQTNEQLTHIITTLCVNLGIENHNVCRGAVALNMPILTYIIRTTPEASPQTFCSIVLQSAQDPNVCPHQDSRFEWQVELPEKREPIPAKVYDGKPFKIAVITDAHIDPLYEPFGVADCGEPTCCRIGQTQGRAFSYQSNVDESLFEESVITNNGEKMLDLSVATKVREHKKSSRTRYQKPRNSDPAGYWGDYRNCDTPIWAYDDAIDTIKENHNDIDMVYYIGDTIDHGVWETSYELINNMNRHLIEKIQNTFGDDVMVVPTIGNHEAQPTNQFAPSSVTAPELNTTWLYKALSEKWGHYLTDDAKATLLERGEFSVVVRPGLRVISLNNNVAYRHNWWLVYDPLDAKRHLDWLVEELYKAESQGEKVHIIAHIPPGVHDLTYTWTREYNKIVNRFSATIAAEFNGHTHSDEFKIFYSPNNTPINMAWGGGSVTSYTFYNLNYKIVILDTETLMPDNIVNYVYNLTEANLTPDKRPKWFLLYDMKNSFTLNDLSAKSMNDLVYSMVTDQPKMLDLYSAFYSKISDYRQARCDDNCKINNLCKTVVTVLGERQRCEELRELFFSTK